MDIFREVPDQLFDDVHGWMNVDWERKENYPSHLKKSGLTMSTVTS